MLYRKSLFLVAALTVASAQASEDPYLWLEGVDDEKALEWVKAENKATADRLTGQPLFGELLEQAQATLDSASRLPRIYQEGDFLYNFWRDAENPRGVLRRTTLEGFAKEAPPWEAVIDIDALSESEGEKWVFKGMNCLPEEPEYCLVRLSPGGGDAAVTREFNSVTKSFKPDGFVLPVAKGGAGWVDEDTLFVATDFGEGSMTDSGYPRIAKRWQRGTPLTDAETLYTGSVESVSAGAYRARWADGHVDIVREGTSFWTADNYQLVDGELVKLQIPRHRPDQRCVPGTADHFTQRRLATGRPVLRPGQCVDCRPAGLARRG